MGRIAIGYARVSTAGQAQDGVSLEAQEARIRAWCQANDYELSAVHVDAGLSGRTTRRPGLQSALGELAEGAALITYSLSRLARSTKDAIAIGELLDKKGADLVSLSERIDTTTAAGKMIFRLLAVLAEFESDLVSERTKAALSHKKTNGQRVGHVPFGYRPAEDGARLEKDEEEQAILAEIRRVRDGGLSLAKIADELNARGITNRGSQWGAMTVRSKLAA